MKKYFIFYVLIFLLCIFAYAAWGGNSRLYAHHHHHGKHHNEVCTVICKEPQWGTFCDYEYEYDWDLKQCCMVKCFKKHK